MPKEELKYFMETMNSFDERTDCKLIDQEVEEYLNN